MKILLVAEYRDGKLLANSNELIGFAETWELKAPWC